MREQRRFPRLNLNVRIEYTIIDKSIGAQKAQIKDISTAGLNIRTNELLEKGVYLYIKFYLPKEKTQIEAISKVAWSKESGPKIFETGIEFVKIGYADQVRIGKLITEA